LRKTLIIICLIVLLSLFTVKAYAISIDFDSQTMIVINIPLRSLTLYKDGQIVKTYPVAVGKSYSQTPIGEFKVINKLINPYYSKGKIPGGSPNNPLGSRWIGFKPHYGIHGNSDPSSIGTYASAGCVRMFDKDVKELYDMISISTPITVIYDSLKVEYDVIDQEPILIVYPDYYAKEKNIMEKVDKKLEELSLASSIDSSKLNTLKGLINKETVVFSNKWTYFINGKYVTGDIISINGTKLINVDKISKYFNIKVLELFNQDNVRLLDKIVPITRLENANYILLTDLEKALGGKHYIDNDIERIDYSLNYIMFNNMLISGEALDIKGNVKVPLNPLIDALKLKVDIKNDKTKIVFKNTEIPYNNINEEIYIEANELTKLVDVSVETYTIDNHVEIFCKPDIIYKGIIYKGNYLLKEVYVPYQMLESINITSSTMMINNVVDTLFITRIDNQKYIKLSDLVNYFDIDINEYGTIISINDK